MKTKKQKHIKLLKKTKTTPKTKKRILIICITIFTIIFLYSSYQLINWLLDKKNIKSEIKQIEEKIVIEEIIIEDLEQNEKIPLYTADFSKLKKENKDVVAFIKVNGTKISYPVVQTIDNDYYLNHSFNKDYNKAGWIFMDYRNSLTDNNIVVYGHGRADGTMFGELIYLLKESFYKNNKYISFITEEYTATYEIFSVYTTEKTSENHVMVDFSNNYLFKLFADDLKTKSIIPFNINIGVEDKIITLSTCKNNKQLIVVHGKMVKKADM